MDQKYYSLVYSPSVCVFLSLSLCSIDAAS